MSKEIQYLVKFLGAIIKYNLGDNAVAIGVDYLSQYAGDQITELIEKYLTDQNIEEVLKRADQLFEQKCNDDHLRQAIHELPLAGAPVLVELAKNLPQTYDTDKFLKALIRTLKTYWGSLLNEEQINEAAYTYRMCLEKSLAIAGETLLGLYSKTEQIEFNTNETLKRLTLVQASVDSINQAIKENFPISNPSEPSRFSNTGLDIQLDGLNKEELQLNAQLDQCKLLLDAGNPNAANKLLSLIEETIRGKQVSTKIWFRLKTLQGGCAIAILDDNKGAKLFEDAFHLDPTNVKAISNLGVARLIQGDHAEAITLSERALEMDPNETSALTIWVSARARNQGSKNLQELVKENYLNNSDYLRTLGLVFYDAGEYGQSVEYLRRSLILESTNRYTKLALVTALISYETDKRFSRYLASDKTEVGAAIKEAEALIKELIVEFENGDSLPLILDAKALRGAIKGLSGDMAGAKNDCDDVLRQEPNQLNALCNRMVIARIENDPDYLLILAERVPDELFARDVQMVHLAVSAHIQKRNFDRAIALIDKYCGAYTELAANYECISIKAWAWFAAGKEKEARDLIAELMRDPVDFVLALENAALFENRVGSISSAIEYLEEMYPKADANQKRSIALKLASLYLQNNETPKAIEWLERESIDITEKIDLAKMFIPALFTNRQLEKAYKACQKLRQKNIKDPALLELEAYIAEMLGDLQLAYELDTELANLIPNSVDHQVNRARLCMRNDQATEATAILKSINPKDSRNPDLLMQLSQMYMLTNEPQKALETMYRARELGIDLPKIHEAYLSQFLLLEDEVSGLEPTEVASETYVLLGSDDEEKWVFISDDQDIDKKDWKISSKSDLAQLLMGHKQGDAVIRPDSGFAEEQTWSIKAIQSKYVRAFQETYSDFNMRFPKNNNFRKIRVQNDDVTPFLAKVAGMSAQSQQMLDLYKKGEFTVDQLSRSIGHNIFDTFLGLVDDPSIGPYASFGSRDDQQYQNNVIRRVNEITIDLSALLTCTYLGVLDLLPKRFAKIYVPQHLLDRVEEALAKREFDLKRGYSTIGHNGTNFYFVEVPKAQIESEINRLRELRSFIKSNCIITAISVEYADQLAQTRSNRQDENPSTLATFFIANQTQTPIFADDARLRNIAQHFLKVQGFWSQALLVDLHAKRLISSEVYVDNCLKLLLAGYHYTSVNFDLISYVLAKHNFETNRSTLAVINALKGPDTIEDNATGISAQVISAL